MSTEARRLTFATLVFTTIAAMFSLMAVSIAEEGYAWYELIMLACFAITLPWTAIGFWNAVIGFALLRFTKNPAEHVFPALGKLKSDQEITTSTAIAICIRNEDVTEVDRNLNVMIARLVATGHGENFHVYILSDSDEEFVQHQEEAVFKRLKNEWSGRMEVTYRLRTDNAGFKAGNIRDFCERWGDKHDFMLTLDADSVMSASTILRLVRVLEQNDNVGLVQSLVVGLPSDSAFTRVFQFGMRMGMKSFTIGSAWWQADCGPYWGHNALIRLKPFIDHCHLPQLPGSGPLSGDILSHDQVEATFMRRAGYECRVIAEECGSYEENPPHLLEFIRRDLRWCRGNMQYLKLLREPGLLPVSRMQLVLAIMMFIGAPAWMVFVSLGTSVIIYHDMALKGFNLSTGYALFLTIMTMIFAPKLVSILDTLMRKDLRKRFGGGFAVIVSAFAEITFSMLIAPIMAVAETLFLAKLPFGKSKGWAQQNRKSHALPLDVTAKYLWPATLFGVSGVVGLLAFSSVSWGGFLFAVPVFVGPLLAIPFALSTSNVFIGHFVTRFGLCQIPEEETLPVVIRALDLDPISIRAKALADGTRHAPLSTADLLEINAEVDDRLAA